MAALASEIRALSAGVDERAVAAQVRAYLDATYPDLASLNPSSSKRASWNNSSAGAKRSLAQDIEYWTTKEADARAALAAAEAELPAAVEAATAALTGILDRAQKVSLARYALSDSVSALLAELSSSAPRLDDDVDVDMDRQVGEAAGTKAKERAQTFLEKVEDTQAALARSRAALAWSSVLERILKMRDATLDPANHKPSPLVALGQFKDLDAAVSELERVLPPGMALLDSIRAVRIETWTKLKAALSDTLLAAADAIKWPLRIDYPTIPAPQRRAFERAYTELLHLQAEGERMGMGMTVADWTKGDGLYPLQALVKPIELRFKYHFMGNRNTNRVDKPEWGFANITDVIYEQENFIRDYLQPLTAAAGFGAVDVKSEFTMLLFPILLRFLRTRIPHLLKLPALLAHSVYQTVLFDDATRESGFDLARTSLYRGTEAPAWEGLAGVILREEDWFEQWLQGEKKFASSSLMEIISASDAWHLSDDDETGIPTTESARQVRALLEQITDRYSALPAFEYRVAFWRNVQMPLLTDYHSRVAGSLDAFETLSSAFVRVIPGALGQRQTDTRLMGTEGLEKLVKAQVSANYMLAACRAWSNDLLFVEMSADIAGAEAATSVWDPMMEKYASLKSRAEDMMVRLISAEVETDLKQHLTRRWDLGSENDEVGASPNDVDRVDAPSTSLVSALLAFTSLLSTLSRTLSRPTTARIYRRVASHLVNHITQRAVFAGWSKFTALGGRALQHEVDDWRLAAAQGVGEEEGIAVDPPWHKLASMATILALPSEAEAEGDGVTFAQAMAAAWGAPSALESLKERAGVKDLSVEELQAVLRRRVECWR